MSVSYNDMLTSVRERIGDDSASPYYSSTFIGNKVNERVLLASNLIARLMPNYYMEDSSAYTTVANQRDYNYTTGCTNFKTFVKLMRRYGTEPNAVYQPVVRRSAEAQYEYGPFRPMMSLPDSVALQAKTVAVYDTFFRLSPTPVDTSEVYILLYLRKPADVSGSTALDMPDDWESYVAPDVAMIILKRKGDPRWRAMQEERDEAYKVLRQVFRRNILPGVQGAQPLS